MAVDEDAKVALGQFGAKGGQPIDAGIITAKQACRVKGFIQQIARVVNLEGQKALFGFDGGTPAVDCILPIPNSLGNRDYKAAQRKFSD